MIARWVGVLLIAASAIQREPERTELRKVGDELRRLRAQPAPTHSR
jgi:hypothetical protein